MSDSATWYLLKEGVEHGPLERSDLLELIRAGELTPKDYVWQPGLESWIPAASAQGLYLPPKRTPHSPEPSTELEGSEKAEPDQPTKPQKSTTTLDKDDPQPSCLWLGFYTHLLIPIAIVREFVGMVGSVQQEEHGAWAVSLACLCLLTTLLVGLRRRRAWGFRLFWCLQYASWIALCFDYSLRMTGRLVSEQFFFALAAWGVLWILPNALYFQHRRHLFS